MRKIVLIAGLAAAMMVAGCKHEGGSDLSAFSSRPEDSANPPPTANYYGDKYGYQCSQETDGHLGRYTCEYRE